MNIIFVGCRGYSVNYGGWETFLHNLIGNWEDNNFNFYVFEIVDSKEKEIDETINGVRCIRVYVKTKSHGKMIIFVLKSLMRLKEKCKEYGIDSGYLYIMGAAIGMLHFAFKKKIKNLGLKTIHNPAGLEWKRDKWNWIVKRYIYHSHMSLARNVDYLVCDSEAIADVYRKKFPKKEGIVYISYGTDLIDADSIHENATFNSFLKALSIAPNDYYLVLGRFVPENNYEAIISQFLSSNTSKKLLIISNNEDEKTFYKYLDKKYNLSKQERILFAGKVYDKEILLPLRKLATAYIHGHSVGGTNPGLLEAMSVTNVNILFDCPFNREVGGDAALYFDLTSKQLPDILKTVEEMGNDTIRLYGEKAKTIMKNKYSWKYIVDQYKIFFEENLS